MRNYNYLNISKTAMWAHGQKSLFEKSFFLESFENILWIKETSSSTKTYWIVRKLAYRNIWKLAQIWRSLFRDWVWNVETISHSELADAKSL